MRTQDIVIGEWYRLRANPNYSYVKAIKIFKRGEKDNPINCTCVKCEHVINKSDTCGLIHYFRPCDMVKENEQ